VYSGGWVARRRRRRRRDRAPRRAPSSAGPGSAGRPTSPAPPAGSAAQQAWPPGRTPSGRRCCARRRHLAGQRRRDRQWSIRESGKIARCPVRDTPGHQRAGDHRRSGSGQVHALVTQTVGAGLAWRRRDLRGPVSTGRPSWRTSRRTCGLRQRGLRPVARCSSSGSADDVAEIAARSEYGPVSGHPHQGRDGADLTRHAAYRAGSCTSTSRPSTTRANTPFWRHPGLRHRRALRRRGQRGSFTETRWSHPRRHSRLPVLRPLPRSGLPGRTGPRAPARRSLASRVAEVLRGRCPSMAPSRGPHAIASRQITPSKAAVIAYNGDYDSR